MNIVTKGLAYTTTGTRADKERRATLHKGFKGPWVENHLVCDADASACAGLEHPLGCGLKSNQDHACR